MTEELGGRTLYEGDVTREDFAKATEAFCTGTATVISPIEHISEPGAPEHGLNHDYDWQGPVLTRLKQTLVDIQGEKIPDQYGKFEVGVVIHGIGMCNEYPQVAPLKWFEQTGYDGEFAPDMTVSVESYIGAVGGSEGVKLEEMVKITETGCDLVANFPFETELLQ